MITLNDEQVLYLEQKLQEVGLQYAPLREDLLDHICCMVEAKMDKEYTFSAAVNDVFATFGDKGLVQLEQQTLDLIHQKNIIMKRLSFLILGMFVLSMPFLLAQNSNLSFIQPVEQARLSSGFGMRIHPATKIKKLHKGIDWVAPIGTPVVASAQGVVEEVNVDEKGYGKHIIIRHDSSYTSVYAHLSAINVEIGQQVDQGTVIGLVGSTGVSSKPHLHYELRKDKKSIDPQPFMNP